jgi:hypothetical protein
MIHGYPTSSFDFMELFDLLSMDYYVCAIDTPGGTPAVLYIMVATDKYTKKRRRIFYFKTRVLDG